MRECVSCKEVKEDGAFAFRRKATGLRMTYCRTCYAIKRKKYRPPLPKKPTPGPRCCCLCGVEKPLHEFYTYSNPRTKSLVYRKTCKACKAQHLYALRQGLRWCFGCKVGKSPEEFYFMGSSSTRRRSRCKACITTYESTPDARRRNRIHGRKYATGFTPELWTLAFILQHSQCAICLTTLDPHSRTAHADHCHHTHQPRGVLCSKCNTAIGLLRDNPEYCRRAARYLEQPTLFARQEWEDLL